MKIESLPNGIISNVTTIKNTNTILNTKSISTNMNGTNHANIQRKGRFNIVNPNVPRLRAISIPNIPQNSSKQMNLNSSTSASESTTGTGTAPESPVNTSITSINPTVVLTAPFYPPDASMSATVIGNIGNNNITSASLNVDETTTSINSHSNTKQPKSPVLKAKKKGRFLLTTTRAPDVLPLYNNNIHGEKNSQQINVNGQIPNRTTPSTSISPSLSLEDQDVNQMNSSIINQNNQQVPVFIQPKEISISHNTTLPCNGNVNTDNKNSSRFTQFFLMCDQMKADMLDAEKSMQKLQMEMKLIVSFKMNLLSNLYPPQFILG